MLIYWRVTHSKYWICNYLKLALTGNFCVCLLPRNGELTWIHHQSIAELPCTTDHQALDIIGLFSVPLVSAFPSKLSKYRKGRKGTQNWPMTSSIGIIPPLSTFEDDPFFTPMHPDLGRYTHWVTATGDGMYIYIYTYIYIHILLCI